MRCERCGIDFRESSLYCVRCGGSLVSSPSGYEEAPGRPEAGSAPSQSPMAGLAFNRCPRCRNPVSSRAVICRYCGQPLAAGPGAPRSPATPPVNHAVKVERREKVFAVMAIAGGALILLSIALPASDFLFLAGAFWKVIFGVVIIFRGIEVLGVTNRFRERSYTRWVALIVSLLSLAFSILFLVNLRHNLLARHMAGAYVLLLGAIVAVVASVGLVTVRRVPQVMKACPYCRTVVAVKVTTCPNCGSRLVGA
ncbi:MAG: zinc ribbon domain-containing protein [Actinobacteria bacterium]|nr:zinc ribbon domain-containing protein [Actinomycetota bacterium]MCG2818361.1 zinc ribbon domain-containing protein [Actinomycetes bacterium]MBU4179552.1 zinc ribbon domain-containing protein [Actinomycetota bacterium]MBU4219899.1 zinc ribbon domain-containing protein [Actinomycetota bacterium]MBU4360068.1 zinc ribbon domain-containing protein [Actinomycetota bacterium]